MASLYDPKHLRVERLQADMSYHAAYNYWNLRGVLAEKWAHGPDFNGTQLDGEQTTLVSNNAPAEKGFLWAIYGLRALGMNAEGDDAVERARTELLQPWIDDALKVLDPKRVVRLSVSALALYPVENAVKVSRRLRSVYYQYEKVEALLPTSLQDEKERFHAAINVFIPTGKEGTSVSLIVGAIGPPHRGGFFNKPDPKRDTEWWMGVKYDRSLFQEDGIAEASKDLMTMVNLANTEVRELAEKVLSNVLE